MKTLKRTLKVLLIILPGIFTSNINAKDNVTEVLDTNMPTLRSTFASESFKSNTLFGDKLHPADFKLDSSYQAKWDAETNTWEEITFIISKQDQAGRDSLITFRDGYLENTKVEFKYDEAGNQIDVCYYRLFEEAWYITYKDTCTYNNHGDVTSKTTLQWLFGSHTGKAGTENKYKYAYEYDENNHVIETSYFYYNTTNENYYIVNKTNYTVLESGNIEESVHQSSNTEGAPLKIKGNTSYKYFEGINKEESIYSQWNDVTKTMDEYSKQTILYNDDNQKTENIYYYYNADSSNWSEREKYLYTYDEDGNLIEKESFYRNDTTQWMVSEKDVFYYSATSSATSVSEKRLETSSGNIGIYPNPAKRNITLQSEKLIGEAFDAKVVNANGQIVFEYACPKNNNSTVDMVLPKLARGLYFVQVSGPNLNQSSKLIID